MTEPVPDPPCVVGRRQTPLSPWFTVLEKDVLFPGSPGVATYHVLRPLPYVAVVAVTRDGRLPLIRQWRPAVEAYTWELPAGLVDEGEAPEETCRRELLEETGLTARSVEHLGSFALDTARVEGVQHVFRADCDDPPSEFRPEPGTQVEYTPAFEVVEWIVAGRITSLLHIGALYLSQLRSQAPSPDGL